MGRNNLQLTDSELVTDTVKFVILNS